MGVPHLFRRRKTVSYVTHNICDELRKRNVEFLLNLGATARIITRERAKSQVCRVNGNYLDGRPLSRYRRRWKVERLMAWLQNFRRILVRWE